MGTEAQIERFFEQYAANFQRVLDGEEPDVGKVAACFAECFVESSPAGVICGKNDEQFRTSIPKGYAFYRQAGITAMDIRAQRIELLDELHVMDRIQWSSTFRRQDGVTGNINFEVIYLLRLQNDAWKIFAYITGDEQQALKDNGLITK